MANEGTNFTTPVGRIVWGHPTELQKKTDTDNKPVLNEDGTPRMVRSFGLAIPKAEFIAHVWPYLSAEAATKYTQGVPAKFSWKYKDCDEIDRFGKPLSEREGHAGCYILAISSELPNPPPIWLLQNGNYVQLPGDKIKCGDYVAVGINCVVNVPKNATHTPGVYVNPTLVELVGEGDAIVGMQGPDPMQALGGVQRALPPGARPVGAVAAPTGIPGMPQPGMPGAPAPLPMAQPQPMQPPVMAPAPVPVPVPVPQPVAMPAAVPGRPIDPAHVYNNGNGTEQWLVNGAWDGQQHPIAAVPAPLPPPQPAFVQGVGMPAQPMAMPQPGLPGAVGIMPPPRQ